MTVWVVAVEYAGPDIEMDHPASRRAILEHAYDIDTGLLAHGDDQLRVGFERPHRGWPTAPQLSRCGACSVAVLALVTRVVADIVGRSVLDLTRWAMRFADLVDNDLCLWTPPPEQPDPLS